MRTKIRKMLRTGCVLAFSSMLLCSCSAPASSALTTLLNAATQDMTSAEKMSGRNAADVPKTQTSAPAQRSAEQVVPVSAMDVISHPFGAAVMDDGALLVTDACNRVVWRVADGASTVYAGSYSADDEDSGVQPPGGYNDASYEDSTFMSPWAIAPFHGGWAVSDTENHAVRLLRNGVVETINAHMTGSRTAEESAAFEHPTGLAADEEGNLYVADTFADTIYKITADGEIMVAVTDVSEPMGICWQDGALFVAESGRNRIIAVRDGEITVLAGSGESGDSDGPAEEAAFASPQGIAVGEDGTIYVADTDNSAVRAIRSGQVTTLYARDVRDLDAFFPVTPIGLLKIGDDLYVCDPFARALLQLPLASA